MNENLTFPAAVAKYNIPMPRLAGLALRDGFNDPMIVERNENGEYLLADDWRLQRLANPNRGAL
jgi:hypothetical protein